MNIQLILKVNNEDGYEEVEMYYYAKTKKEAITRAKKIIKALDNGKFKRNTYISPIGSSFASDSKINILEYRKTELTIKEQIEELK